MNIAFYPRVWKARMPSRILKMNMMSLGQVQAQVEVLQVQNSQSIATPSPFQLMVSFNPSTFKFHSQLAADLGNIRFYSDSLLQNILLSWVESGTSTSTNAVIWVLLPNGIAANTTITIYMAISSNQEFDGINAGQAPQLSSTYAKYDNGASVFSFYDNFAGTSLSSKWVGTATVNNGATLTTRINTATTFAGTFVFEQLSKEIGNNAGYQETSNVISTSNGNTFTAGAFYGSGGTSQCTGHTRGGTRTAACGLTVTNTNFNIYSIENAGSIAYFLLNYQTDFNVGLSGSSFYLQLESDSSGLFQWVRVRAYPPNGVQPTVTFL